MKRFIHSIVFVAAALVATSCVEPLNTDIPSLDQDFTLSFSCGVMTKAEAEGSANENLVKRVDYFIFPYGADGKVADDQEYVYSDYFVTNDTAGDDYYKLAQSYRDTIGHQYLADIFPDGNTKAVVFAVANYVDKFGDNNTMRDAGIEPNTTIDPDAKTWKALHELEVGPTFFYDDKDPDFLLRWPHTLKPDDKDFFLVMACDSAVISLTATSNEAAGGAVVNGYVPLARLASKVTVNFTYQNVTDSQGVLWTPQPDASETRVYLSNAIEHTTLGGPLQRDLVADDWGTATKPLGNGTRDIFEYAYNFMNDVPVIEGKRTAHFYTYPLQFDEGDDNQPYLKLVLPWYGYKNGVKIKQKEVYYKIVIPRNTINEGNRIYEYSVTVNIVGSDKEIAIQGDYVIKDWPTNTPISSNVATGRYISLDIPKDEYNMYVDTLDISFVSSGTVLAKVIEIYQENYNRTDMHKDYFMQNDVVTAEDSTMTKKGIDEDDIKGWVTIPEETSYLEIAHAMDNNMLLPNGRKNPAFDVAPYVFKVRLHLEEAGDDDSFDRIITITQYPAIYVTSTRSNGYAWVNHYSNQGTGNRICYDDRGTGNSGYRLGNFAHRYNDQMGTGQSGTGNDNPNLYMITATILPDDDYVIGDPREKSVRNPADLGNWDGPLTDYRPTATGSTNGEQKVVAPKLIVASSYGAISSSYYFNKTQAEKRCASYQESGYPAGRWRMPTYAEMQFMMTLSGLGYIPPLFSQTANDNTGYWCANGKVIFDGNALPSLSTTSTSSTAVRCVYDAWYWGEEPVDECLTAWKGFYD